MNGFNLSNVSSVYVGSNSAGYVYLGSTKIWEVSSGITPPQYVAPTAKSGLVYNGLSQALLNAGSTNDGTIQYSTDNTNWSTSIPTATNAGNNITVYWRLIGDASHSDVLATSITCVISKANFTTSVSIDGWFDNESANAPQITNNLGNGSVVYRYKRAGEEDSAYTTTVPTIAGTYIIEATVSETTNYNSATATNNFFIHPADTCSIIYFADSMLTENTSINKGVGLAVRYAFYGDAVNDELTKVSHTFSNGIGILTFNKRIQYVMSGAFISCEGLKHVVFPHTVISIDKSSIINCTDLKSINIPYQVRYLNTVHNSYTEDNSAIGSNPSVKSIIVENDNRKNLYFDSRNNCNSVIETATNTILKGCGCSFIPEGITSIARGCFSLVNDLISITIPNSVTSIGSSAFYYCPNLASIVVKNKNGTYDSRSNCNAIIETETNTLIFGCNNTIIPNSVTSIGNYAFSGRSGLTSITIPNSVTSLGDGAFYECSGLTSITIPNSVTSIGLQAFYYCPSLTSVTIGSGITSIGALCFNSSSALLNITFASTIPPTILSNTFENCNNCTLYVPLASVNTYKNDSNWSRYASRIVGY